MNETESIACGVIGNELIKNERRAEKPTVSGIYGLRCKTTNKWYVGQSVNIIKTWHQRYELLHCKGQPKILRALLKYGYDDFDKVILEECVESDLNVRESHWSGVYNSVNAGYNTRECGGSRGKHSIETKRKMREKGIGRKHTAESIEKMVWLKRNTPMGRNHPSYGKTHTEESRQKIKAARAKQTITEESNQKRRLTMQRIWETRRKNGTIKNIGEKITEAKKKEWAVRKSKMVDKCPDNR